MQSSTAHDKYFSLLRTYYESRALKSDGHYDSLRVNQLVDAIHQGDETASRLLGCPIQTMISPSGKSAIRWVENQDTIAVLGIIGEGGQIPSVDKRWLAEQRDLMVERLGSGKKLMTSTNELSAPLLNGVLKKLRSKSELASVNVVSTPPFDMFGFGNWQNVSVMVGKESRQHQSRQPPEQRQGISRTINLIDPESISRYLEGFCPENPEVAELLKHALARPLAVRPENCQHLRSLPDDAPKWLQKKWPEGGPYHRFAPNRQLDDQVRHIADWIEAALPDKADALHRRDKDGKPFEFVGIRTLEDATTLANEAMKRRNRALAENLAPVGEGEETVKQFENGYRIVKLTSPSALRREGVAMGHCIGQRAYDGKFKSRKFEYYSLRDQRNEPHATIEVETARHAVIQCQGKENKAPVAKYLPYLQAYLQEGRYKLEAPAKRTGLVQVGERYHSIYNLPKDLKIEGDLDLSGTPVSHLPEGLKVGGNLDLFGTKIIRVPIGLKVGKNFDLRGTKVTELPDGLKVGGNLELSSTEISSLPRALNVGGSLILSGTRITHLSMGLKFGKDLDLSSSHIVELPDGLKVSGNLDLTGTGINQLPSGLKIRGDLDLTGTAITDIPADAVIKGDIFGLSGPHAARILQSRSEASAADRRR